MASVCRDCIILIFIKANLLSYYIASFMHMCCVSEKTQASLPFSNWMNYWKMSSCPSVFWHELHGKMGHMGEKGNDRGSELWQVHLFPGAVFPWPTTASRLTWWKPWSKPLNDIMHRLFLSHTHAHTHIMQQISISQPQSTPSSSLADFPFFFSWHTLLL